MTTSLNMVRNGSIALIAFVLLALPLAAAHAADVGDGGDSYDFYPDQSYDFYPDESSYDFYPDQSYDSGYTDSGYMGGSYLSGSGFLGSSYLPSRPASGGNTQSQAQSQAQVSNNTNVNNNIITINTPSTPTYTPPAPVYNYPVCTLTVNNYQNGYNGYNYNYQPVTLSWTSQYATSGYISNGVGAVALSGSITVNPQYTTTYTGTFYGQNGQTVTCSATVTRSNPIVYNNQTPYVALSAVPYTGLDLGFWGTIAYWGFLILWCLVAAYLVVVKKIQNRILKSLNSFLFGNSVTSHEVAVAAPVAAVHSYSAPAPVQVDAIDPFIVSQINRVRA